MLLLNKLWWHENTRKWVCGKDVGYQVTSTTTTPPPLLFELLSFSVISKTLVSALVLIKYFLITFFLIYSVGLVCLTFQQNCSLIYHSWLKHSHHLANMSIIVFSHTCEVWYIKFKLFAFISGNETYSSLPVRQYARAVQKKSGKLV